jgi:hypothetical protein
MSAPRQRFVGQGFGSALANAGSALGVATAIVSSASIGLLLADWVSRDLGFLFSFWAPTPSPRACSRSSFSSELGSRDSTLQRYRRTEMGQLNWIIAGLVYSDNPDRHNEAAELFSTV